MALIEAYASYCKSLGYSHREGVDGARVSRLLIRGLARLKHVYVAP